MATTTVLRPSALSSGVGWSAVPSGTLYGVTSDDSDSTYALWAGTGSALILATPVDSPPAGERRHLVRIRARGEDGSAWWAVRLATGGLVAGAAATFPASPATVIGSWAAGAPPDGATILSTYVTGQTASVKIEELYIDVDTRAAPTFTPQVLDGSGTSVTIVTDTATPTLHASALDLDGLVGRQFRYWVTDATTAIVWDSGILSGNPVDQSTLALPNGNYTAHLIVWSTLGTSTAYSSGEQTLAFSIAVGEIPVPDNPTVDQVDGTPFFTVTACAPNTFGFDFGHVYIEIQRIDCYGTDAPTFTTVTVLGPLLENDCASYVDYSLPRTGLGASCEHDAEQCCSVYRTRTVGRVDGALQISAWSDSLDPGLPAGLTLLWAGTNASIPAGWSRDTGLDGRYLKQVPNSTTDPGTTGGATTHTHTSTAHTHDESHLHTVTGNTGTATGTASIAGTTGSTVHVSSHTHTRPSTNSATVVSGSTAPAVGTATNELDHVELIAIQSDGTPLGAPPLAVSLAQGSALTGWTAYAIGTQRFVKGAATGADAGTLAAGTLDGHSHSLAAHTHTGTAHAHTSANTGTAAGTNTVTAGATAVLNTATHAHTLTANSASSQALASGGSATSGTATGFLPPYRRVTLQQNTSGVPSLPVGTIGIWRGILGTIPNHWQLADGQAGIADLRGRYPLCVPSSPGSSGGFGVTHSHTANLHNHTTTGHSHTETVGAPTPTTTANASTTTPTLTATTAAHIHSATDANSTTPTVATTTPAATSSAGAFDWEPPYTEVAFIQLTTPFVPQPDPDPICLTWDEDQHLIRSTGPDGPIWSNVGGIFEWDRDRPFSTATGVNGNRFVTSAPPGERNLHMTAAVENEDQLATLQAVLQRPLVLISPSDSTEVWAAPVAASVTVVKIGRIRQVTADFIGTGPQPEPQLFDVGE